MCVFFKAVFIHISHQKALSRSDLNQQLLHSYYFLAAELWHPAKKVPCINILAHLYRWVQRNCCSSLPSSSECPWTRPSGWVPGRLMDGAHPLWPTEFYLRLTSRCCHRRSARSSSLINLSPPLRSIHLLHFSLHSLSLSTISLSLSSHASSGQSLSLLPPHLSQQASFFTLAWPLPFIRLTNKVESKHPHRYMHVCAHTIHLFTASKIWVVSWVLPAICWTKKTGKRRA